VPVIIHPGILLLLVLNFLFIGLLPRIFFRKDGCYNLLWLMTAMPYILASLVLLSSVWLSGSPSGVWAWIHQPLGDANLYPGMTLVAVLLSAVSIALIALTIGTHQKPLALWHQTNDAPEHLVDYGAYRYIRHPFYASFLLALLAALLAYPTPGTAVTLVYGYVMMNTTAAREEERFLDSSLGEAYQAYMQRTGRFIPTFWRR
jgi:protein-S-isoprenylcysteine O-methyltransferase Ste14